MERNRTRHRPVLLAAVVTALCMVGNSMLYVVLPVHWEEFGLTAFWQAGMLLSVNRFVRLPLNPLVSRLYRRLPARQGMLGAAGASGRDDGGVRGGWHVLGAACAAGPVGAGVDVPAAGGRISR